MLLFQKYFVYRDILPECISGASLVPNESMRGHAGPTCSSHCPDDLVLMLGPSAVS